MRLQSNTKSQKLEERDELPDKSGPASIRKVKVTNNKAWGVRGKKHGHHSGWGPPKMAPSYQHNYTYIIIRIDWYFRPMLELNWCRL